MKKYVFAFLMVMNLAIMNSFAQTVFSDVNVTNNLSARTFSVGTPTPNDGTLPYGAINFSSGIGILCPRSTTSLPNYLGIDFLTQNIQRLRITNAGFIGIGSALPQSLAHIYGGNLQITNSSDPTTATASKQGLMMGFSGTSTPASTDYAWIQNSNGPLLLNPLAGNSLTTTPNTNKYVAIGYTPSAVPNLSYIAGYNLFVQGRIMCEELKIQLKSANWYDHVLHSDYSLMSLDSLQSYIAKNSHLPDIPSAEEVEKNGIMAGEMSGLLLKKVEELTLYAIDQNKKMNNQNEEIELLKRQNELLMKQLEVIIHQQK